MGVRGDERGQAIQVGAIVLFAFLLLAFAGYQAVLVPQQNAAVEQRHSQAVADDVVDLRSAIVEAWSVGESRPATVGLGTTYPPRVLAVNPPAPGGTLETEPAGEITVAVTGQGDAGPVEVCGETAVPTRTLAYTPAYNEYAGAPTVGYEHSVVYRRYDDAVLLDSGQRLVQDGTVNLLALATPYGRTGSGAASVDVIPGERTTTTVTLSPGQRLEVTVPSRLNASVWETELLDDQPRVVDVSDASGAVTVTLAGSQPSETGQRSYTVVCRPVGLDRTP